MDECVCGVLMGDVLTCLWCGTCVTCCHSHDHADVDTHDERIIVIVDLFA